jgi:predicted nucleic acid-binding protein
MRNLPRALAVDTGFFFALYEPKDQHHAKAVPKEELLESTPLVIPWPCLYETVNSRFVKKTAHVEKFEKVIGRAGVVLVNDAPYRDVALELTIKAGKSGVRPVSLADTVIRLMLDDVNVRIGYLLTFNVRDFVDVCRNRGIELV